MEDDDEEWIGESTTSMSPWTAAAQLLHGMEDGSECISIDVPVPVKVPLSGSDLRAFHIREEQARQTKAAAREQVREVVFRTFYRHASVCCVIPRFLFICSHIHLRLLCCTILPPLLPARHVGPSRTSERTIALGGTDVGARAHHLIKDCCGESSSTEEESL